MYYIVNQGEKLESREDKISAISLAESMYACSYIEGEVYVTDTQGVEVYSTHPGAMYRHRKALTHMYWRTLRVLHRAIRT